MGILSSVLGKLLPLERLISLAARFGLLKEPLRLLAVANGKLRGVRTQASLVLAVVAAASKYAGWIPHEVADPLIATLLGAAVQSAAEKVAKVLGVVDQVGELVDKQTQKPGETPPAP